MLFEFSADATLPQVQVIMRPYYVKRKKHYFKIEKQRETRRFAFLVILVVSTIFLLFWGIHGSSRPYPLVKKDRHRSKAKASQAKQKVKPSKQPQKPPPNLPKVAIVIDDVGFVQTHLADFQRIKVPITFSVIPHTTHGRANAELFHLQGQEIMVHLPMETKASQTSYGPGEVSGKMSDEQIVSTLDGDLALVPYIKGLNNHEGTLATTDKRVMTVVVKYAQAHGLFFLDSLTSPHSIVSQVQGELGMPKRVNDVFLDHQDTVEYVKAQMQRLADLAKKKGVAIGIGHIQRNSTAQGILEMIPVLQSQGIEFVFISQIPNNR